MEFGQSRQHQTAKAPKAAGPQLPHAALIFHDAIEAKQAHRRRVRMHLDLEAAFLARCDRCSVAEAHCFQAAAKCSHVLSEGAPEICGMATCVEPAEVAIQLALRG